MLLIVSCVYLLSGLPLLPLFAHCSKLMGYFYVDYSVFVELVHFCDFAVFFYSLGCYLQLTTISYWLLFYTLFRCLFFCVFYVVSSFVLTRCPVSEVQVAFSATGLFRAYSGFPLLV